MYDVLALLSEGSPEGHSVPAKRVEQFDIDQVLRLSMASSMGEVTFRSLQASVYVLEQWISHTLSSIIALQLPKKTAWTFGMMPL